MIFDALDITKKDLALNKTGRISSHQIHHLAHLRLFGIASWLIVIILLPVVLVLFFTGSIFEPSIAFCPVVLIVFFVLAIMNIPITLKVNKDLKIKSPSVVEGQIRTKITNTKHSIYIDDMSFDVDVLLFRIFKNGDPYRIYYAPHTKQILSAVWLPGENPFNTPDDELLTENDLDDASEQRTSH